MAWEPITSVEQLVGRFENGIFDYKTTYDLSTKATRYDIAKDISAFASAFGGTIIVGVKEGGGNPVGWEAVENVACLTKEIATALQAFCVPIPVTPEECVLRVTPSLALQLIPCADAPPGDLNLVALNVRPDARGPIGVRTLREGNLKPVDHAFTFPIRLDDQTRFVDPTELPMWMNSHERRIGLRLHQIPRGQPVHIFQEAGDSVTVNIGDIDEHNSVVGFSRQIAKANVPLAFVDAVWMDPEDSSWCLKIQGSMFRRSSGYTPPRD